jgi:hypothetical protein
LPEPSSGNWQGKKDLTYLLMVVVFSTFSCCVTVPVAGFTLVRLFFVRTLVVLLVARAGRCTVAEVVVDWVAECCSFVTVVFCCVCALLPVFSSNSALIAMIVFFILLVCCLVKKNCE